MDFRRSDTKIKLRKKNINYLKYAAAISVSITTIGLGIIFSWTSPALPYLTSPASSFQVSEIQGAWIASLVGCGTISGFLINPILINRLGSKQTLLFLAMPQIVSWIMIYLGKNWLLLCFARIIGGFGYGAGLCSTAIYLSEIGDERTRGIFLTLIKMSINIGIFISMFFGAFLSYDIMNLALSSIPIIFVVTFFSMPDAKQLGEDEEFEESVMEKLTGKGFVENSNDLKNRSNGFEENSNGLNKHLNDFAETTNGSNKHLNGSVENSNGLNNHPNGSVENSNGLNNHPNGFVENSNGLNKHLNGLAETTNGLNKHPNVSAEHINGPNKNTNGPDKNTNGPDKNTHGLNKSTNSLNNDTNGLNEIPQNPIKSSNNSKEKVIDVLKEETVVLLQNHTILLVKEDTVDIIESKTIDVLNENTSCLLNENSLKFLKENSNFPESPIILPIENEAKENLIKREETFDLVSRSSPCPSERKSQNNVWWRLFFLKNNRKAFLIILVASLTDIFSGHMAIVSYTQQIFEYSGASLKAEYAALILAILKIGASFISTLVVEKFGRRDLFLVTGILAGLSQGLVGFFFFLKLYLQIDITWLTWLPLLGVSMYEVVGSVGLSSLYYVYQGELFSDDVKGLGVTCTNISYEGITFFIKLYFQIVIDTIGIYSVFWIFGICCVVGSCFVYWISPETKGKSKEEIQKLLGAQ